MSFKELYFGFKRVVATVNLMVLALVIVDDNSIGNSSVMCLEHPIEDSFFNPLSLDLASLTGSLFRTSTNIHLTSFDAGGGSIDWRRLR